MRVIMENRIVSVMLNVPIERKVPVARFALIGTQSRLSMMVVPLKLDGFNTSINYFVSSNYGLQPLHMFLAC